jgi:ferrochelatase
MYKKALILLNMGGARNKDELKMFLTNMFNDKNILNISNGTIRSIIAYIIVTMRYNKAWENYKKIDGKSPIYDLTDELIKALQEQFPSILILSTMSYTPPFAQDTIKQLKEQNIKDITLLPLYPQYSTTTTKSSIEEFKKYAKDDFNIKTIEPFYKNELYNQAICNEIVRVQGKYSDYHLIFSAHSLPQKIIKKGDPYQKQIEEHVEILKEKLSDYAIVFKSINLAYQSKVGIMKWIEPSLGDTLKYFKDEKILIYPISFILDNSETTFELDIEYRQLAQKIGIKKYKVCKCVNSNDKFIKAIKMMLEES